MQLSVFRNRKLLLVFIFLSFTYIAKSQQANQFNSWWLYQAKGKINERLDVEVLYAWCRNDFVKNWQQSLIRGGLNFQQSQQLNYGLGYAWIKLFPYGEQPISVARSEHRIFENLTLKSKISSLSFSNRIRLEQRIIGGKIRHRIRNRLALKIPLFQHKNNKTALHMNLSNELFVQLSKQTKTNLLEQNRVYLGLNFTVNRSLSFNIGYLNQYILKSTASRENNHTLQVGIAHKFKLGS